MWEINNGNQAVTFLLALGLGAIFSFLYDFFKALRLSRRHSVLAVALEDLLFSALCTLFAFAFFIFRTNGQPRGYAYVAMGVGFAAWRIVFSKYYVNFLRKIFLLIFLVFSKFKRYFYAFLSQNRILFGKVLKKLLNSAKKVLKGAKRIVYNLFKRIIGK